MIHLSQKPILNVVLFVPLIAKDTRNYLLDLGYIKRQQSLPTWFGFPRSNENNEKGKLSHANLDHKLHLNQT